MTGYLASRGAAACVRPGDRGVLCLAHAAPSIWTYAHTLSARHALPLASAEWIPAVAGQQGNDLAPLRLARPVRRYLTSGRATRRRRGQRHDGYRRSLPEHQQAEAASASAKSPRAWSQRPRSDRTARPARSPRRCVHAVEAARARRTMAQHLPVGQRGRSSRNAGRKMATRQAAARTRSVPAHRRPEIGREGEQARGACAAPYPARKSLSLIQFGGTTRRAAAEAPRGHPRTRANRCGRSCRPGPAHGSGQARSGRKNGQHPKNTTHASAQARALARTAVSPAPPRGTSPRSSLQPIRPPAAIAANWAIALCQASSTSAIEIASVMRVRSGQRVTAIPQTACATTATAAILSPCSQPAWPGSPSQEIP